MIQVTVDVYNFSELSEEAQQKVIEKNREDIGEIINSCEDDEWEGSLDAFCKEFNITAGNWQVGYPTYHGLVFKDDEIYEGLSAEDVKGKLLWRYLDYHRDNLISPKEYWGQFKEWNPEKQCYNVKTWTSHINYDPHYSGIVEDGMSLTGVYSDYDLLKPLMEWRKHPDEDTSLYDLIDECLDKFFSAWEDNREGNYKDDVVRQELLDNDSEQYCVDGSVFHGVY